MDDFAPIKYKIINRYKPFIPTFAFINTKTGTQMMVKLNKNDVELLVNINEKYTDIFVKIDSLIIIYKNRKSDTYCICGYNMNRFKERGRCKSCKMLICVCCHFQNFRNNQGALICYNCGKKSTKKIKPLTTFQRIFNKT